MKVMWDMKPQQCMSVRDWYETLVDAIIQCADGVKLSQIELGTEVLTVLMASLRFKPLSYGLDSPEGSLLGTLVLPSPNARVPVFARKSPHDVITLCIDGGGEKRRVFVIGVPPAHMI